MYLPQTLIHSPVSDDTPGLVSWWQRFSQCRLRHYNRSYILETEKKTMLPQFTVLTGLIFLNTGTENIFSYYWQKDQGILLWAGGILLFVAGMKYCSVSIQTSEHLYPVFTGTVRYLAQPQKGMFSYKGLKHAVICCCVIFWYSLLWKKSTLSVKPSHCLFALL